MFSLSKSVSKLKSLKSGSNGAQINGRKAVGKTKTKKRKVTQKTEETDVRRGVVMISNFPIGFYEKQMFEYFSQFGKILRIRISKNKKTGKRRNYGFIEFEFEEVAQIVANTMDNYLMFDHIVKCKLMPHSEVKERPNLFRSWNKAFVSSTQIHKSLHNKNKSIEREFQLMRNRLKKVRQMENQLKEKGIEFKCQVINLPDISQLRQQRNATPVEANTTTKSVPNNVSKSVSSNVQKSVSNIVRKHDKRVNESVKELTKAEKSVRTERRRDRKRVLFPKLYKFSIILSANKKMSNSYSK